MVLMTCLGGEGKTGQGRAGKGREGSLALCLAQCVSLRRRVPTAVVRTEASAVYRHPGGVSCRQELGGVSYSVVFLSVIHGGGSKLCGTCCQHPKTAQLWDLPARHNISTVAFVWPVNKPTQFSELTATHNNTLICEVY